MKQENICPHLPHWDIMSKINQLLDVRVLKLRLRHKKEEVMVVWFKITCL